MWYGPVLSQSCAETLERVVRANQPFRVGFITWALLATLVVPALTTYIPGLDESLICVCVYVAMLFSWHAVRVYIYTYWRQ